MGEGINAGGQLQVYFDVGHQHVMVVCPTRELHQAEFSSDPRPVRSIVTLYFISYTRYEQNRVIKLF